jgi:hypothetical protein
MPLGCEGRSLQPIFFESETCYSPVLALNPAVLIGEHQAKTG